MLKQLTVTDFALVSFLDVDLTSGLTVITGESGAGKSIVLGALGLVIGERANTEVIRHGAQRAVVSAEFELDEKTDAYAYLMELALADEDQPGRCLVRRVVSRDGRSRAFINGTPVTRQVLRTFTEGLIDIHGQHENQRLASKDVQLALLDDYGVIDADLQSLRASYRAWRDDLAAAERLRGLLASREDRASLLNYQLEELATLALAEGEFERIEKEHKRLSQAHDLRETVAVSLTSLEDMDPLRRTVRALEGIDDDQVQLVAAEEFLTSALSLIDDAMRDLRGYDDTLEVDPEHLTTIDARLALVHELSRKHQVMPADLASHYAKLQDELNTISMDRTEFDTLLESAQRHEAAYKKCAMVVSKQRHSAANGFSAAVSRCIKTLGIEGGELSLKFSPDESERGLESVEFRIVTNPNYPSASLSKIASGGERARISLAIQVVAAQKTALPCLVLDEADVGVGGTAADVVGRLLRALAEHTQVICVTHAPQVAALGDQHLRVHKDAEQDTHIEPLAEDTRIDELARMLAGADVTEESRDYARTLLKEASAVH
ncbi:MAG: DNA repair protein RecN [Gammaproteobacteria bacterium]|nr:MAG: DNA repair protein RecN [Gammaproteobacteria bacterium]